MVLLFNVPIHFHVERFRHRDKFTFNLIRISTCNRKFCKELIRQLSEHYSTIMCISVALFNYGTLCTLVSAV
jgi:hypothetical protein